MLLRPHSWAAIRTVDAANVTMELVTLCSVLFATASGWPYSIHCARQNSDTGYRRSHVFAQ